MRDMSIRRYRVGKDALGCIIQNHHEELKISSKEEPRHTYRMSGPFVSTDSLLDNQLFGNGNFAANDTEVVRSFG